MGREDENRSDDGMIRRWNNRQIQQKLEEAKIRLLARKENLTARVDFNLSELNYLLSIL